MLSNQNAIKFNQGPEAGLIEQRIGGELNKLNDWASIQALTESNEEVESMVLNRWNRSPKSIGILSF